MRHVLSVIDRFIPADVACGDDERHRLQMSVVVVLLMLSFVPACAFLQSAEEAFFEISALLGIWGAYIIVLGAIRQGLSATITGHLVTGLMVLLAAGVLFTGEGRYHPLVIILAFVPALHATLVRGSTYWLWFAANLLIVLVAMPWGATPNPEVRNHLIAVMSIMTALTLISTLHESSRRRSIEASSGARQQAESVMLAKGRFLANVSHQLRVPLNGILGMQGILLETRLDRTQRDHLRSAQLAATTLLDLINDILDFSRIEAGQMKLERSRFDLRCLIEDVLELVAVPAAEKGIELVAHYMPDTPTHVEGDYGRIQQILLNFVTNAVKFTKEGHVLVKVEELDSSGEETIFRCSVEDTGVGISKERQQHIFNPSPPLESTSRLTAPGLGLAIVRELIGMMGGNAGVSSELGVGTCFRVDLPLPSATPSTKARPRGLKKRTVLIASDRSLSRKILREQMGDWCLSVEEASLDDEVLERLRRGVATGRAYDFVIIDDSSRNQRYLELVRQIKADSKLVATLVVMLGSVTRQERFERWFKLGCSAVVLKPVRTSALVEALSNAWSESRTQHHGDGRTCGGHPARDGKLGEGLKVLVVEDSVVNQKVAQRALINLGARVEVAADGYEAFELTKAIPFDLVLMDLEMPYVDGLKATAKIRQHEGVQARRLPIVAVTARVEPEYRERCLAAGMDDYIAKPLQRAELIRILRRFGKEKSKPTRDPRVDEVRGIEKEETELFDMSRLELDYGSDEVSIHSMLSEFSNRMTDLLDAMSDAISSSDEDELEQCVHTLVQVAKLVHATAVLELVESWCPPYPRKMLALERLAGRIREHLRQIERSNESTRTIVES